MELRTATATEADHAGFRRVRGQPERKTSLWRRQRQCRFAGLSQRNASFRGRRNAADALGYRRSHLLAPDWICALPCVGSRIQRQFASGLYLVGFYTWGKSPDGGHGYFNVENWPGGGSG